MDLPLPVIPAKRYFTIGEVGDLCGVKPHVLRYWEQEFTQLRPMKRRGNRRYYQHHEVLMIRKIRDLLYDQGFTISGARNKMQEMLHLSRGQKDDVATELTKIDVPEPGQVTLHSSPELHQSYPLLSPTDNLFSVQQQLLEIRVLLTL
jgi:DNA-binding transcriptional MerR regulator